MEIVTQLAWIALALIHLLPAVSAFRPSLIERLYGVSPSGDLSVILQHRGVLFVAIVVACIFGALEPSARRPLAIVVAISVVGFLISYARAGMPRGPLRRVALVDAIGLVPLAIVVYVAWFVVSGRGL
jgi:hypothetical protein